MYLIPVLVKERKDVTRRNTRKKYLKQELDRLLSRLRRQEIFFLLLARKKIGFITSLGGAPSYNSKNKNKRSY